MTVYCPRCGSANEEFAEFCASCGEKIAKQQKKTAEKTTETTTASSTEGKQLFRSRDNKMITGLSAGLAKYLNMDVDIVRLLWIIGLIVSGGAVAVVYLIMAMVIPLEPEVVST